MANHHVHTHIPGFTFAVRLVKTIVMHVGPILLAIWLLAWIMGMGNHISFSMPKTMPKLSMPAIPTAPPGIKVIPTDTPSPNDWVQCVVDGSTTVYYGPKEHAPRPCDPPAPLTSGP